MKPNRKKLVNALHEIVSFGITEDKLSVDMTADIVGMSTRSHQRLMKKHDISFNVLLNIARQHYAETELNKPEAKISDIAYQPGYNDTAHLTRAFKRWTGMTPSKYRKTGHYAGCAVRTANLISGGSLRCAWHTLQLFTQAKATATLFDIGGTYDD